MRAFRLRVFLLCAYDGGQRLFSSTRRFLPHETLFQMKHTSRVHTAAIWTARVVTGISAILLVSSLFVPWAYASIGPLDLLFGVPGMKACLRHTDVCKKIDWEHTSALPYVLDGLLSAAASHACGSESFSCAQVVAITR